eukprot:5040063-Prymnesium_polylepis.1
MALSMASFWKDHSAAAMAFAFLVGVGVSKTLFTKLVFMHQAPRPLHADAGRLVLSCLERRCSLNDFRMISKSQLRSFAGICLAIALDLGCQNVALAMAYGLRVTENQGL